MTDPTYRITDWNDHFENNRTRELKKMRWVPVPNKHDSDGYTELLSSPNGPENFCAWVLLLEVASKCNPRGTLLRDNGNPHTPESLARMTHTKPELFSTAIPVLIQIGWLEEVKDISHNPAPSCEIVPSISHPTDYGMEWNGMEEKGKEEKEGNFVPFPDHPKKRDRRDGNPLDEIMKMACRKLIVRDPAGTRQFFTNAVEVKGWLSWERLHDEVFAAKKDSYPLDIIEPFKVKPGDDRGARNMPSREKQDKRMARWEAETKERANRTPEQIAEEKARTAKLKKELGMVQTRGDPK